MSTAVAPDFQASTMEPPPEPSILTAAIRATETKLVEVQKFELHQRQARLFALSNLFADIKGQTPEQSIAQAFVKIDLGESMGLSPAEAMTGIDLIQGRVAISANIRAAKMQRAGYDWDVLQLDDKGCRLRLKYKGQPLMQEETDEHGNVRKVPVVVAFTEREATRAGLIGKDNYKKNPPNMYFARAITNAQRWYAPGILTLNILSSEEAVDLPVSSATEDENQEAAQYAKEIQDLYAELKWPPTRQRKPNLHYANNPKGLVEMLKAELAKSAAGQQEPPVETKAGPKPQAETKAPAAETKQAEPETKPEPVETKKAEPVVAPAQASLTEWE